MLGDPAGLTLGYACLPDRVEQTGLAMVDVAHDGDDRRPRHDVLRTHAFVSLDQFFFEALRLDIRAELACEHRRGLVVERGVDRHHEPFHQQLREDLLHADAKLVCEILDGCSFAQGDGPCDGRLNHWRRWCRRPGVLPPGARSVHRPVGAVRHARSLGVHTGPGRSPGWLRPDGLRGQRPRTTGRRPRRRSRIGRPRRDRSRRAGGRGTCDSSRSGRGCPGCRRTRPLTRDGPRWRVGWQRWRRRRRSLLLNAEPNRWGDDPPGRRRGGRRLGFGLACRFDIRCGGPGGGRKRIRRQRRITLGYFCPRLHWGRFLRCALGSLHKSRRWQRGSDRFGRLGRLLGGRSLLTL